MDDEEVYQLGYDNINAALVEFQKQVVEREFRSGVKRCLPPEAYSVQRPFMTER